MSSLAEPALDSPPHVDYFLPPLHPSSADIPSLSPPHDSTQGNPHRRAPFPHGLGRHRHLSILFLGSTLCPPSSTQISRLVYLLVLLPPPPLSFSPCLPPVLPPVDPMVLFARWVTLYSLTSSLVLPFAFPSLFPTLFFFKFYSVVLPPPTFLLFLNPPRPPPQWPCASFPS